MHKVVLDSFKNLEPIEWCYHRHNIKPNSHPASPSNTYLIWDPSDELIGEATSLIQAKALIH